ncbi:Transposon TX1 uncharacterized 149 kDa protein ORF 2 [Takifugu flavidus]|uniref:Transposon TX1 uncharacterized 149 kDa protein ORF 2 n=1 Tax=Takifugu flavidus TaxID=433684 RepID=A0A5C6P6N6_9TELE|nr:Transposon TX1 uncharacterized 149 kDa protein ORF 2 [Takifugu flavidus]
MYVILLLHLTNGENSSSSNNSSSYSSSFSSSYNNSSYSSSHSSSSSSYSSSYNNSRHAVKLSPPAGVSVEECALAVGEIVGHGSVESSTRMNSVVVVFVDSIDKADQLVVTGVAVNGELTLVFPLSNPVKKSPLLRHLVSFRRQVAMVLNNNKEELKLTLRFRVDEFDYTVFVTTDYLKCLSCREEGHMILLCPNGVAARRPADLLVSAAPGAQDVDRHNGRHNRRGGGASRGDHLDLGSEHLTRELVEQTATRVAKTVLEMEDVVVEENSLNESNSSRDMQETFNDNDNIQVEKHHGYSLSKIRSFLRTTKGMRSVQVEDYFTLITSKKLSEPVPGRLLKITAVFLFLGGDCNCTENPLLDGNHPEPHLPSKSTLTKLVQALELCDVWRYFHPGQKQFTWTHSRRNQLSLASYSSTQQWLDVGKVHIKQFCLQYTLNANRDMARSMREVGALVHSRFQHIPQMDAPSHFFFGLEWKNGQRRMIHSLRANNGQVLEDPIEIRQRAVIYYRDLYRKECREKSEVDQSFLSGLSQGQSEPRSAATELQESCPYPLPKERGPAGRKQLAPSVLAMHRLHAAVQSVGKSDEKEKAFDRVEQKYLWRTLQAFGFSPGFIARIQVLYSGIKSVLKINGGLSAPFIVQRGIRQGCSLSGMLYTLEPLLRRLRVELSGFTIPGCLKHYVVSAFADDIIVFINSQNDITNLCETVTRFNKLSSAKGWVLVINNLVSSMLWHYLACVDPPPNLLSRIQAVMVDFFWDRLHWIPQSVLFLPREEGGLGLVHLESMRSVRVLNQLLGGWRHQLAASELELVSKFCKGRKPANHDDPFPDVRETVFYCFSECGRLSVLFLLLSRMFSLLGQVKLAIYVNRRNKVLPSSSGLIEGIQRAIVDFLYRQVLRGLAPSYLEELVIPYQPNRPLRSQNAGLLVVPRVSRSRMGGRAFSYQLSLVMLL